MMSLNVPSRATSWLRSQGAKDDRLTWGVDGREDMRAEGGFEGVGGKDEFIICEMEVGGQDRSSK